MSVWKTDKDTDLIPKGTWDADTNTPFLSDNGVGGIANEFYVVSVAGTTSLDGISSWAVGDWVLNSGTKWFKVPNANAVSSVAGRVGAIVLVKADVTDFVESAYVHVTGDETVAGKKTFSTFTETPNSAPTTSLQTANKKYVDDHDTAVAGTVTTVASNLATEVTNRTNGDALSVHLAGTETITGQKSFNESLILPKTSGKGLMLDPAAPTYGWKDLIGFQLPDISGANAPTLSSFIGGGVRRFAYSSGDKLDMEFHIPHDYVPGTDLFVHVHWSHNGTAISGNFVATINYTYAKGHNQANFSAEKTVTITYPTVNIATTPRYRHRIDEVQLSSNGGSATLLDSSILEVDSIIGMNMTITTIPTITGGSPNDPFVFFCDIHYQSTQTATKQKAPPFYI